MKILKRRRRCWVPGTVMRLLIVTISQQACGDKKESRGDR